MCHSNCNFVRSGLPIEVQKRLAEHFWGSADAVDAIGDYKPTNKYKMIRAKWSIERKELHDMQTVFYSLYASLMSGTGWMFIFICFALFGLLGFYLFLNGKD